MSGGTGSNGALARVLSRAVKPTRIASYHDTHAVLAQLSSGGSLPPPGGVTHAMCSCNELLSLMIQEQYFSLKIFFIPAVDISKAVVMSSGK